MSDSKFGPNTGRIASQILSAEPQRKPFGGGTVYFPEGDRPTTITGLPIPKFGARRIVVQRPHALPFEHAVGAGGDGEGLGDSPDFAGVQDGIAFANEQASAAEYDADRALGDAAGASAPGFAERHMEALSKRRDAALAEAPNGFAAKRTRVLFDEVMERQGRRALGAEHEARQTARIQGTETALGRLQERALNDPANLEAHIDEGRQFLGRMVETGLSGAGAAVRAREFEDQVRRGVLESLAKGEPRRALESLDAGAFDAVFEDEDGKARIRDGLDLWSGKQEQRARDAEFAEAEAGRRRFAAGLAAGFADGSADALHVDLALASGAIDEAQADDLRLRLSDFEAHNRELGRLDGVLRGYADTVSNDPSMVQEPFNAAAVDAWWQGEAARDPEAAMAALPGLVQRTGLVPAGLRNGIRAVILDGAPAVKVEAGAQLRGLLKSAPWPTKRRRGSGNSRCNSARPAERVLNNCS